MLGSIQLLVLDVDGTVLTRDHRILRPVVEAVARARAAGLVLALATARSPRGLRPIALELGILEHCICFNGAWSGAVGTHATHAKTLEEAVLSPQLACAVVDAARAAGLSVGCYLGETWRVPALTQAIAREAAVTGEVPLVDPDLATLDEAPHKILCIAGSSSEIPALHQLAQTFGASCAVSFSHTNFLEITAEGVDKARAVSALAARLGTELTRVAAIGDSDNDRALLETVGLGIAMGNAPPDLRSRAAWVTLTNQEAGVARAIERLIGTTACGAGG